MNNCCHLHPFSHSEATQKLAWMSPLTCDPVAGRAFVLGNNEQSSWNSSCSSSFSFPSQWDEVSALISWDARHNVGSASCPNGADELFCGVLHCVWSSSTMGSHVLLWHWIRLGDKTNNENGANWRATLVAICSTEQARWLCSFLSCPTILCKESGLSFLFFCQPCWLWKLKFGWGHLNYSSLVSPSRVCLSDILAVRAPAFAAQRAPPGLLCRCSFHTDWPTTWFPRSLRLIIFFNLEIFILLVPIWVCHWLLLITSQMCSIYSPAFHAEMAFFENSRDSRFTSRPTVHVQLFVEEQRPNGLLVCRHNDCSYMRTVPRKRLLTNNRSLQRTVHLRHTWPLNQQKRRILCADGARSVSRGDAAVAVVNWSFYPAELHLGVIGNMTVTLGCWDAFGIPLMTFF